MQCLFFGAPTRVLFDGRNVVATSAEGKERGRGKEKQAVKTVGECEAGGVEMRVEERGCEGE